MNAFDRALNSLVKSALMGVGQDKSYIRQLQVQAQNDQAVNQITATDYATKSISTIDAYGNAGTSFPRNSYNNAGDSTDVIETVVP